MTIPLSEALRQAHFDREVAPTYEALLVETAAYLRFKFRHELITVKSVISYARHTYTNYEQVLKQTDRSRETREMLQVFYACMIVDFYQLPTQPLATVFGEGKEQQAFAPMFAGVKDTPFDLAHFILERAQNIEKE